MAKIQEKLAVDLVLSNLSVDSVLARSCSDQSIGSVISPGSHGHLVVSSPVQARDEIFVMDSFEADLASLEANAAAVLDQLCADIRRPNQIVPSSGQDDPLRDEFERFAAEVGQPSV